jgi:hypothetical protein
MVCRHNCFSRRTRTAAALLLTKNFRQAFCNRAKWFIIATLTPTLFIKYEI